MKVTRNKTRACGRVCAVGLTLLTLATAACFCGCSPRSMIPSGYAGMSVASSSSESSTKPIQPPPDQSSDEEIKPPPIIKYRDFLTGLPTEDEAATTARPISIVIDNRDPLLVQYGTADASIWVEAPIESGATRIMLLYSGVKSIKTVASVASTRSYLVELSSAFGAVAAYAGTTDVIGEGSVAYSGSDTLDYILQNLSSVFFRDTTVASPYSLLTDGIRITNGILNCRYSSTRKEGQVLPFQFSQNGVTASGLIGKQVSLRFSDTLGVSYAFDETGGLYYRSQNQTAHTDAATGEQIALKNLLLLSCDSVVYEQQNHTKLDFDLQKGGSGYAVFDGVAVPIRWSLKSDGSLSLTNESGNQLTLPAGKTYIGVLKSSVSNAIQFGE